MIVLKVGSSNIVTVEVVNQTSYSSAKNSVVGTLSVTFEANPSKSTSDQIFEAFQNSGYEFCFEKFHDLGNMVTSAAGLPLNKSTYLRMEVYDEGGKYKYCTEGIDHIDLMSTSCIRFSQEEIIAGYQDDF